ncbi:MAG: ImmA/IrrE family metallo-endopeptidase [Rhodothermaceae bacterium]|nr:ImmA/IrrE family metallo-endopeptidase [Rhodothermaceae bacterium]MXZ58347.1 ImmA/IrrE family metallo-endopeptidase [Rhodothermaceae bacterium]MYB91142.1 ImmA/IrrE family metallo-endopeptidase [Rhodothermaceae bacterium]MYD67198.1 ImmA/IrrE family metallo-endopeptidase [Rhodothermaceae bacterium]MYG44575.1 ImmA/IrrE family metallo-endopeptidase [Rhodothermaceae bacterium]
MSTRIQVNPDLLHWALQRAGVSADALADKFPKLNDWLGGVLAPTLKQLEAFANTTHTAIGLLFLPHPPEEPLPIPDFRKLPGGQFSRPSINLLDTIYLCQQRQAWYQEYQHLHGMEPVAFIGSASTADEVPEAAARIAQAIGFDLIERQQSPNWSEAMRRFISQIEQTGILVMVSGVVGSNTHRPLNVEEFRGFALADPFAPLIFINGKDSKAAQMFTLAHELAHLWLGESGVSDTQAATQHDEQIECWCNAVAAELLVPLKQLRPVYDPENELNEEMQRLARRFKVSTLVIVRRLFDLGVIDQEVLWVTYRAELEQVRALGSREGSGGDFYNTLSARTGKRFIRALVASTLEGQTQFTDAFRMLGIKKTATFYEKARRLGLHG